MYLKIDEFVKMEVDYCPRNFFARVKVDSDDVVQHRLKEKFKGYSSIWGITFEGDATEVASQITDFVTEVRIIAAEEALKASSWEETIVSSLKSLGFEEEEED